MAMPEERSPRFLKAILPDTLQNGSIEIPQRFLKKYGKCLPRYACLEVPTGAMWKVELKRCQDRVYLHQGLQDFVEHCSIKSGYSVVFRYDGGSFFHVHIFDTEEVEIEYPLSAVGTHRRVDLDQSKDQEVEVDDDTSVEILDQGSRKLHKSIKVEDIEDDDHQEEEEEDDTSDDSDDDGSEETSGNKYRGKDHVTEGGNRPLQRAREFQSPNPHFFITMKPAYVRNGYLHIPADHARSYFSEKENNSIHLIGADGRAWFVNYSARIGPRSAVAKLYLGWRSFVNEYRLEVGDVCIFELIKSSSMTYKVTIIRIAAEDQIPDNRVLHRLKDFKSSKPHFMIRICQTNASPGYGFANVPAAYAKRYLQDGKNVIVFYGSNGRAWPVSCHATDTDRGRAKLRSGWMNFVLDNQLKVGDVCAFEMIDATARDYKVTILRGADYA